MKTNKHGLGRVTDLNLEYYKTNHAVYLLAEESPNIKDKELALALGKTVALVQMALKQLRAAGYVQTLTDFKKGIRTITILKPLTLKK
tara:strand:+ start:409 stop:672 length:264 start_codon:yes stop_codon:yes gene_type:complete